MSRPNDNTLLIDFEVVLPRFIISIIDDLQREFGEKFTDEQKLNAIISSTGFFSGMDNDDYIYLTRKMKKINYIIDEKTVLNMNTHIGRFNSRIKLPYWLSDVIRNIEKRWKRKLETTEAFNLILLFCENYVNDCFETNDYDMLREEIQKLEYILN